MGSKLKRNWIASKYSLNKPNFNYLSIDKLQESKSIILKLFQNESFHQEIEILQKHSTIHRCSQIIVLDPIFNDNLLRVGGRLKFIDLALNCHSQIIIDKRHPLAPLIVKRFRESNLHCEREQTLSDMIQRFWIPSCRGIINKVLKICSFWKRRRAKPRQPFMSNIPSDKLAVNKKTILKFRSGWFWASSHKYYLLVLQLVLYI